MSFRSAAHLGTTFALNKHSRLLLLLLLELFVLFISGFLSKLESTKLLFPIVSSEERATWKPIEQRWSPKPALVGSSALHMLQQNFEAR